MYGGGYGGGMGMGPMGGDPNDPNLPPPQQPPASWLVLLQNLGNIVGFFGRISFLVSESTNALNFFMTALLQVSMAQVERLWIPLVAFLLPGLSRAFAGKVASVQHPFSN